MNQGHGWSCGSSWPAGSCPRGTPGEGQCDQEHDHDHGGLKSTQYSSRVMASTSKDMTMMRKRTDLWFVQEGVVGGSNFRLLDHRSALFGDHLSYYDCHNNCQNCHPKLSSKIVIKNCHQKWSSRVMSPHRTDQMSQWSQVSRIALCMAKVKVTQWLSESVSDKVTYWAVLDS